MKYLTRQEAAARLAVSLRTLDGLIARGQLPAYKVGPRLVRLKEQELDDYISARLVAPEAANRAAPAPGKRPCLYVPGMKVV